MTRGIEEENESSDLSMSPVDSIQITLFPEEQKRVVEGKNDARELAERHVPIRNDVHHSRKINSHVLIIVEKRCKWF